MFFVALSVAKRKRTFHRRTTFMLKRKNLKNASKSKRSVCWQEEKWMWKRETKCRVIKLTLNANVLWHLISRSQSHVRPAPPSSNPTTVPHSHLNLQFVGFDFKIWYAEISMAVARWFSREIRSDEVPTSAVQPEPDSYFKAQVRALHPTFLCWWRFLLSIVLRVLSFAFRFATVACWWVGAGRTVSRVHQALMRHRAPQVPRPLSTIRCAERLCISFDTTHFLFVYSWNDDTKRWMHKTCRVKQEKPALDPWTLWHFFTPSMFSKHKLLFSHANVLKLKSHPYQANSLKKLILGLDPG